MKLNLFSPKQRSSLAIIAGQAYDYQCAKGLLSGISADEWRREEVERLTGYAGLTQCPAQFYNKLASHFSDLAGRADAALNHLLRESTEPKRQAEAVLLRELSKAGLPLNYAESISRDKFQCAVLDCDTRQLWQLIYTVRNRSKAKRRTLPPPCPVTSL